MDKKLICLVVLIDSLCLTSLAFGQLTNPGPEDFPSLLKGIATTVGTLIPSLGTVMVIVAGIFYLTSAGSPERIGVAKKTLIYAVAGIAIGLAADAIVTIVTGFMAAPTK